MGGEEGQADSIRPGLRLVVRNDPFAWASRYFISPPEDSDHFSNHTETWGASLARRDEVDGPIVDDAPRQGLDEVNACASKRKAPLRLRVPFVDEDKASSFPRLPPTGDVVHVCNAIR